MKSKAKPVRKKRGGSSRAAQCSPAPIPMVLFDGNAVWHALDEKAKTRTSPGNVCDVLDAVVSLMRRSVRENDRTELRLPGSAATTTPKI